MPGYKDIMVHENDGLFVTVGDLQLKETGQVKTLTICMPQHA